MPLKNKFYTRVFKFQMKIIKRGIYRSPLKAISNTALIPQKRKNNRYTPTD